MGSVEFDEEKSNQAIFTSRTLLGEPVVPGTANLLIKWGVAKNPRQAMYVMVFIIAACLCASAYLFFLLIHPSPSSSLSTNRVPPAIEQQLRSREQAAN